MPGKAAAALPASLARARPRACRCFFTHSFTPPDGLGDGTSAAPPPVIARMIVLMVIPNAVRIDAMVIPWSRKKVRSRSRSFWSPVSYHRTVSRIRLTCDRRDCRGLQVVPLFYLKLTDSVSKIVAKKNKTHLTTLFVSVVASNNKRRTVISDYCRGLQVVPLFYLKLTDSVSNPLQIAGVVRFRQFPALQGQIFLSFGQLRQVVRQFVSDIGHRSLLYWPF